MTISKPALALTSILLSLFTPLLLIPVVDQLAVASHGSDQFYFVTAVLVLIAALAVLVFLGSLIGLVIRRLRLYCALSAVCSLIYVISIFIALQLGQKIRMNAFLNLAERSKPLVTAIRAYEEKYQHPPESLNTLVPEFLASVPSTGMRAYPSYNYKTPTDNYNGNPWVITISTSTGLLNFDQFMYFPLTNYPSNGYGGYLQRIGDWAYVHE